MAVKNTMKAIDKAVKIMNPFYDLSVENVREIEKYSTGSCDVAANAFLLGYLQGTKALKEEYRKRGVRA